MGMSVGRVILVVLAMVVLEAAIAFAVTPFDDSGVVCGSAVTSAVHGTRAEFVNDKLMAMPKGFGQDQGLFGLSGHRLPDTSVVACRSPARHRLALVSVIFGVSMVALGIAWRRLDPGSETARAAVLVVLVAAILGATIALAVVPFTDSGVLCATPLTSASSGPRVVLRRALPPQPYAQYLQERKQMETEVPSLASQGLRIGPIDPGVVVCRSPARGRLGVAGGVALASIVAFFVGWRRGDQEPDEPDVADPVRLGRAPAS